jgi:hypothetical protein
MMVPGVSGTATSLFGLDARVGEQRVFGAQDLASREPSFQGLLGRHEFASRAHGAENLVSARRGCSEVPLCDPPPLL